MNAHEASMLCRKYALSLASTNLDWSEVALECAAIIDDASKGALTINEIGSGCRQEVPAFILQPEIDYCSGIPRK